MGPKMLQYKPKCSNSLKNDLLKMKSLIFRTVNTLSLSSLTNVRH